MSMSVVLAGFCWLPFLAGTSFAADPPVDRAPIIREVRELEGWKVHVDQRLLAGEHAAVGTQALRVLGFKLYEISKIVPKDRVEKLRAIAIVLDHDYRLNSMQYHPSADWLKKNDHDPTLVKRVHIPKARELVGRLPINQQPMVILHELAHGYHDQVLGFDEAKIKAAWAKFRDSGKYETVPHVSGKPRRHYALTNQMEFFAEMTESYFGTNDFFPFVRGELQAELPEVHKLLEEVWGKSP